ncbi:MAG: hypothetical protein ABI323_13170 [Solirubrobacteraceae bacterium]
MIPERDRVRTRLWTHLHASRLDQALAAGASPDSSAPLSLRARDLIGAPARRDLARSVRGRVDDARRPFDPRSSGVPVCRRKVLASRETLWELADRLTSGEPVEARGVAQVRLLLIAGDGPLYHRPGAADLEPAVQAALAALEFRL